MKTKLKLKNILPVLPRDVQEGISDIVGNTDEIVFERKSATNASVTKGADLKEGERAVIQYVSTRDMDRDNEVLMPKGCVLSQFKKAPQVLWGHNYSEPPVGKDEWIEADDRGIKCKTVYADTPRGEELWKLRKGGFLKTSSVGFIPLESISKGKDGFDKLATKLEGEWPEFKKTKDKVQKIIKKWLLLEHSDVSVPANINALTLAVAKGMEISDGLREELGVPKLDLEAIKKEKKSLSMWGDIDPETDIKVDIDRNKVVELMGLSDLQIVKLYEEASPIENPSVDMRPFPNEHSCRVMAPGKFDEGTFRRVDRSSDEKKLSLIMGKLKGENTLTLQAFRYPKGVWAVEQARNHCKEHDGKRFEPAKGETGSINVVQPKIRVVAEPGQIRIISEDETAQIKQAVKEALDLRMGKV